MGPVQTSSQHGGAEHQQNIPDDRAGNRRFHHIVESGTQRRQCDDQFGGVAEGEDERVQFSARVKF